MSITVSELYIYPIKSCAGLKLSEAHVVGTGFAHDREWMIVKENGWFITQRQLPRMALVQPELIKNGVRLRAPNMPSIEVPIRTDKDAKGMEVRVWDDIVQAVDQGDAVAAWLAKFLDVPCRLVRMEGHRPLGEKYQVDGTEETGFADAFPFLFVSQASLDDLNGRMDAPVPITRFRPNIVVAGGVAFQEDNWKKVKLGSITFRLPKPCSRCEIITIDQKTAVKDIEPMETLGTYRYQAKGIMFGQNAIAEQTGVLRVGDSLAVLE